MVVGPKGLVLQVRVRGEFWSDGYYIETIGRHNSEQAITQYIKQQGKEKEYILLHKEQLSLFKTKSENLIKSEKPTTCFFGFPNEW